MPERFDIRYAARRDRRELRGILDCMIAGLTEADRQALVLCVLKCAIRSRE